MERKHKRPSSGAGLYAVLAICLMAAGIGGYRILKNSPAAARNQTAIVSAPARMPDQEPGDFHLSDAAISGDADISDQSNQPDQPDDASENNPAWDANQNSPFDTADTAASGGAELPDTRAVELGEKSNNNADSKSSDISDGASDAQSSDISNNEPDEAALRFGLGGSKSASPTPEASPTTDENAVSVTPTPTVTNRAPNDTPRFVTLPLDGETVTAFSMDELLYNETLRDWRTHDGVDIAAEEGTPVLAADAGTVESVENDAMMGMTITIRHDGTRETIYACLGEDIEIEAGDEVSAGQVIGFVGTSGPVEAAVEPHLHFSVREDGAAADPAAYLPD